MLAGCVPTARLTIFNDSGKDLMLSAGADRDSCLLAEKYALPKKSTYEWLEPQGGKRILLLTEENGRKYFYQIKVKEEKEQLHTQMYLVIDADMSLQIVDHNFTVADGTKKSGRSDSKIIPDVQQ